MANVCSACGSAHCLRFGGAVCMHTKLNRQAVDREGASPAAAQAKAPRRDKIQREAQSFTRQG